MTIKEVQAALVKLGFDPKGVDGIWGRNSIAAARAFQRSAGIEVDGVVGPVSVAAIAKALAAKGEASPATQVELPWMAEMFRRKGLHEKRDNKALRDWLKSDGRTLGDPAQAPWCGDAVETAIALTLPGEPLPANPYLARNWMKFGRPVDPVYGAVGSFWRTDKVKSTNGHVGFIIGLNNAGTHYRVLGGNQSDTITDTALLAKDRLLGARWPISFPLVDVALVRQSGGVVSTNEA